MSVEIEWNGETITEPGVYTGISLEDYHNKIDLLDGPSVSKSSIKHMLPSLGGSPKKFWHLWPANPNRILLEPTKALNFGKATHALILGDEVFSEKFAVQPAEYPSAKTNKKAKWNNNATYCRDWAASMQELGRTIITIDQVEKIKRMAEDAAKNPLVRDGILNGKIERSMLIKDEETGIWFKSRPDNISANGFFADLKTTSAMTERFISSQLCDNGYFIQAAGVRRAARELGLPFDSFTNVYVSSGDTPDTQHVELAPEDLDLGEEIIRASLDTIAHCLKTGDWPGARPFDGRTGRLGKFALDGIRRDIETLTAGV